MKNLLAVSALVLAVAPAAMASKARVNSLNNSRQLVDFQTAFSRPYQFMALSSQAAFEYTSANSNGKSDLRNYDVDGGFLVKGEESVYGMYINRRTASFDTVVGNFKGTQEINPMNFFYATKLGDWNVGGTFKYSHSNEQVSPNETVQSAGIALGASNGMFDIEVTQGLRGQSGDIESKGNTSVGFGYHIDDAMEVYAEYGMTKAEGIGTTDLGVVDGTLTDVKTMTLGFVHQVYKADTWNAFYGVAYKNYKNEISVDLGGGATIEDEMQVLPIWIGGEYNVMPELVLRGSVAYNVGVNEVKSSVKVGALNLDESGDTNRDDMAVNVGLGYTMGKGVLDVNYTTNKFNSFDPSLTGPTKVENNNNYINVSFTQNF